MTDRVGRAWVGTSGFAYPGWAPRFYPSGSRSADLLAEYAARLSAVELHNTFYRHPSDATVAAWTSAVPADFRFAVKAQRGGSFRALRATAQDSLAWLLRPYRLFGERLGAVLVGVPRPIARDDGALARLLDAWPRDLPLALELPHPSWADDEVHARLRAHGAVLVATDADDDPEPVSLRRTGPFLYLRLRRAEYADADLDAWAARLAPFLADGVDVHVFLRHDMDGSSALRARSLYARLGPDAAPRQATGRSSGSSSRAPR